ncbi:MAG: ferrous iron transporter B [Deltaproteobacteria bacterium]|nr:ferrous iron transporter B [Deltaproteobacteria bacterium]
MNSTNLTVALIGNTGVGKTTLCEQLRFHTSSRPPEHKETSTGTEDARKNSGNGITSCRGIAGACRGDSPCAQEIAFKFIDTPSTGMLFQTGSEEGNASSILIDDEADALAIVADAKNLRRSMAIFLQAAEFKKPTAVILNMMDEATSGGLEFNIERLSEELTVPVRPVVAVEQKSVRGLPRLFEQLVVPSTCVQYPKRIESSLAALSKLVPKNGLPVRAIGLLLLVGDKNAKRWVKERVRLDVVQEITGIIRETRDAYQAPLDVVLSEVLFKEAARITELVTRRSSRAPSIRRQLGILSSHPVWGIPIALGVIVAGYFFVGKLGASIVVDTLNTEVFGGVLMPLFERATSHLPWEIARSAVLDPDFGLVPTALFLALGIVAPVLFFFYLFFGVLESSGYLSRLSIMMDRLLRKLGLNGKGVLPLVFGFSCVTTAILTTRILPSRKERNIATLLLLLGFPCAPLLAVMMVILAPLPASAAFMLFGMLGLQITIAGLLANKLFKGRLPDFVLELPPLRLPKIGATLAKAGKKSFSFLKEALPIFMIASFLLFVCDRFGALDALERGTRPLVQGILGLPDQAVQVFIKTIIRRENGAAELAMIKDQFSALQMVITLYVMTILTPCVNAAIVVVKERGVRFGVTLMSFVCCYAFIAGSGLHWICRTLGVTFT